MGFEPTGPLQDYHSSSVARYDHFDITPYIFFIIQYIFYLINSLAGYIYLKTNFIFFNKSIEIEYTMIYNTKHGNNNEKGTPVPIPNTEVKLLNAEDTCRLPCWENRSSPVLYFFKTNSYFL